MKKILVVLLFVMGSSTARAEEWVGWAYYTLNDVESKTACHLELRYSIDDLNNVLDPTVKPTKKVECDPFDVEMLPYDNLKSFGHVSLEWTLPSTGTRYRSKIDVYVRDGINERIRGGKATVLNKSRVVERGFPVNFNEARTLKKKVWDFKSRVEGSSLPIFLTGSGLYGDVEIETQRSCLETYAGLTTP